MMTDGNFFPGFLLSLAAGILLGALYDALRILRLVLGESRRRQFMTDFLFLSLTAPVTFLVALAAEAGQLRFYILAGEGMGFGFWSLTFGELTIWAAQGIIRLIVRIKITVKKLVMPVVCCMQHRMRELHAKIKQKRKNKKAKRKKSLETT